ncbi:flagellar biosynthesis protein FlhA [Tepidiforma sp.]|uniref:flagellar biosynthesis protein FlhA n=1 Tax=Tepidiforma sp. TaxID=2682230 RepID=UPI0021DED75E|nr:flagellar biosynthesis protein FlhA [Tepidiforma sp.]MCX7618316.1 flagellar biosynthesis protein FlhA [Tepidiforma sp.]GIW18345.1 MAG: flagellar biosynthesis protein FlhA [Tepidiforma sp.]
MTVQAQSRPASASLGRLLGQTDILLAAGIITIVGMMIIPLPAPLLDVLLTINLAVSVVILLVAIYTEEPLKFSVFPSLLLITTLYRLALNVSTSRLILLHGDAGEVVHSFGSFVVGGNLVVGLVVFLILVVIQFVVITNGAGRVAEVAARFTLDAMPGKQMAIDADLNAGLINEAEARERRKAIGQEADFYGAMDGASKFVKGDAIAGIVIILVNIIGGLSIGILQQGVGPAEALNLYAKLTVGDGLVSQLPALLISTATGIIVTRAAGETNLGSQVFSQITMQSRPMYVAAAMLALFAALPGLPRLPFLLVAATVGAGGYLIDRSKRQAELAAIAARPEPVPEPEQLGPQQVIQMMTVDPLEIEVGYGLIPIVDEQAGGTLLRRITQIRRQLALELGIVLPTVRVRDNLGLAPNAYVVKLRGVEIARGTLQPGHYLAMDPGTAEGDIPGIETVEPAFGLPARWITPAYRERAELLGYTVVDAESVLATHLTELVRRFAPDLLSRQDTQDLLENLRKEYPALVDDLIPSTLTVGEVQEVLQNLLAERVSIRDLVTICETLATQARLTRDIDLLTEYARAALARQISRQYADETGTIRVITVGPRTEEEIAASIQQTDRGSQVAMAPWQVQRLVGVVAAEVERVAASGRDPVILCSSRIRLALRRLLERRLPNVVVLSFAEITPQTHVEAIGNIEVNVGNEALHR